MYSMDNIAKTISIVTITNRCKKFYFQCAKYSKSAINKIAKK